jgi:hypothetical protein
MSGSAQQAIAEIEAYLRRYPSGRFSELAQLQLDQMLARQGEKKVQVVSAAANPFSKGTAVANLNFRVGDRYVYRSTDMLTMIEKPRRVQTVTAVTENEVVYNNGRHITDLLGNILLRAGDQARFGPSQFFGTEYSLGKKWSTRYSITFVNGKEDMVETELKVVAREEVTVPAGTFDAFRIEGTGWTLDASVRSTHVVWVAPDRINRYIASEIWRRRHNRILYSERDELVAYTPAA